MFFDKKAGESEKLNVASAHIMWRSLVDRNISIEHFDVLKNFVHNKEFKAYLENTIKDYRDEANKLTNLLNKYSIVGTDQSSRDQNITVRSEIFNDQNIAGVLLRFMRLDLNILMLGMKETPTNEGVYNFIGQLARKSINRIDAYIDYLKENKWIQLSPQYFHSNPGTEDIAGYTIYSLWDHLTYRYNNIRLTQILSLYVTDQAFNAMLRAGIKVLQMEVKSLEDELLYFGVPLPKPYSSSTVEPRDKDIFEDRFIFNQILRGIQDAVVLHGTSIQDAITNDRLRKLFIKLTFRELAVLDDMVEYGKSQGWTYLIPEF